MTYLACKKRFPRRRLTFKKFKEIKNALRKGLPINKSAALPLWNSNRGIIPKSSPEELIFEEVARISTLWCERIIFVYATKPQFDGQPRRIGSAEVAYQQCSNFLRKMGVTNRFVKCSTTTKAVARLKRGDFDACLCSRELAEAKGLNTNMEDCANPYNVTTFSEFAKVVPPTGKVPLVAINVPKLDNGRITPAHVDLMAEIFGGVTNFASMPKFVFAMQTREDRYGILIEFPNFNVKGLPLHLFEEQPDVQVIGEAGNLQESFSSHACAFLLRIFKMKEWHNFASYGLHEAYFCACPKLDIFVQGYKPNVVEQIARLSLRKHVELFASKVIHPNPAARELLNQLLERVKGGERIEDFVEFVPL